MSAITIASGQWSVMVEAMQYNLAALHGIQHLLEYVAVAGVLATFLMGLWLGLVVAGRRGGGGA